MSAAWCALAGGAGCGLGSRCLASSSLAAALHARHCHAGCTVACWLVCRCSTRAPAAVLAPRLCAALLQMFAQIRQLAVVRWWQQLLDRSAHSVSVEQDALEEMARGVAKGAQAGWQARSCMPQALPPLHSTWDWRDLCCLAACCAALRPCRSDCWPLN